MAAFFLTGGFLEVLGRALFVLLVGFSLSPVCKCSKMPIQTLKQSSQRLKPYFRMRICLVCLQIWH